MPRDALHLDRARAESFGSIADAYDRHRPAIAAALIDELVALRPSAVLDVACGTGRAARALMARGLSVLGVEVDERMAAVARSHGVAVEVAPFETWHDRGRRFDLLTCGSAWHWIDPEAGPRKAASVLHPGGRLVLFWTHHVLAPDLVAALDEIYRRTAPAAHPHGGPAAGRGGRRDLPVLGPCFTAPELRVHEEPASLTADEWVALVATFSDHQRLDPATLAAVQAEVHAAITAMTGGVLETSCRTLAVLAERV